MRTRSPTSRPRDQGILLMDTLFGMTIVMILLLALGQSFAMQQSASRRLADQRTALSYAVRAVTALEAGEPLHDVVSKDVRIEIVNVTDGPADTGLVWVEVKAVVGQASEILHGLAARQHVEAARLPESEAR